MQGDIIQRFRAALPSVRQWIDHFVDDHATQARAVSTLGFRRLSTCFPQEVLQRARVVTLARVPFPPVDRLGLPELAPIQRMSFAGITFKDTFFIQRGQSSESLHFHEMVHIVQWARLGVDNFLLAYGMGLLQFGYASSPLEQMAYTLQASFDTDSLPEGLVGLIETRTDAIWGQLAPVVGASDDA